MTNPVVSVIVPTKNSAATLEACLQSIKEQTYCPIELIVVDNHSSDTTQEIAKQFTDMVFVQGPERSPQRNLGARKASGHYLLMIDSDMELDGKVVEACISAVSTDSDISAVIIPEESFGVGFWSKCKQLERSFYQGVNFMEAPRFFSKAAYEAVGGYDESMVSGEDWDLSRRIERMGKVTRTSELIRHNEGRIKLQGALRKKYYYAYHARAYLSRNPERFKISSRVGPIQRYKLFLSRPSKLFARPLLGVAMLAMKTAEFASGSLGYIFGIWRKSREVS